MRKIFAIMLFALLLGVGVVALIETDPGYILLAYGNYTLETSLWVGLVLLIILTVLVYGILRVFYRLLGGQRLLMSWLGTRKSRQTSRQTTRGLISFVEGSWSRARRQLLRGAQNNEAPLLNYLLAARASYRLHEPDKVSEYLVAAGDSESGAADVVTLTRAEMKMHARDYEQAVAVLEELQQSAGRHPYAVELLRDAYYALQDWSKLAGLLPELKKHKLLPDNELLQLEREVYGQLLRHRGAGDTVPTLDQLHSRWQKLPSDMKQDRELLQSYVQQLIDQRAFAPAEKTILRALKQQWDSHLVRQYGFVQSDDIPRQLARAESWLAAHADDAQLLLCLGRLSARDKLWGKARDYFESSYRVQRSAETCAELGRLLQGLGEAKVAAAYFREGLMMQQNQLPQLPMPEKTIPHAKRLANS